jgi:hypothetical protein
LTPIIGKYRANRYGHGGLLLYIAIVYSISGDTITQK